MLRLRLLGPAIAAGVVGAALLFLPQGPAFSEGPAAPLPQATAASPQGTPVSPQPVPPERPVKFYQVDPIFLAYYQQVDGPRVMGGAISPRTSSGGVAAQYFEKARLEDQRANNKTGNPTYDFEYGLLVDEMKAIRSLAPVGGERSTVTYDTIQTESAESKRIPPPGGFSSGVQVSADGSAFVPFSANLSAAAGHTIPKYFWDYLNRSDLFPAGWLHDIGLPITEPIDAVVDKGRIIGGQVVPAPGARIVIQGFQRTILTYDPNNPAGFLVERANTGTDYSRLFPQNVPNP
jgi:hypothetical protein